MLANNEVDFIFHGRVTAWDHSPMTLITKEAGGEVLMFNNESTFNSIPYDSRTIDRMCSLKNRCYKW